jgi:hypothetical protein
VALSDDEQRILRQIEEQLQTDERFAQAVSSSGIYRHSVRTVRWAVVGAVVGLVAMVAMLQVHFLVSFVAFLWMLGCTLVIERQVRLMGRVGAKDIAESLRPVSRLRERFTRD